MIKNFSFLFSKSPIRFCPENPIQISRRAKRGEPSKLAISSMVRGRGFEPPSSCERYHLKVVRLPFRHPRNKWNLP